MRRKQTWGDRNQSSEIDYIEKNLDVIAYVELAFSDSKITWRDMLNLVFLERLMAR